MRLIFKVLVSVLDLQALVLGLSFAKVLCPQITRGCIIFGVYDQHTQIITELEVKLNKWHIIIMLQAKMYWIVAVKSIHAKMWEPRNCPTCMVFIMQKLNKNSASAEVADRTRAVDPPPL